MSQLLAILAGLAIVIADIVISRKSAEAGAIFGAVVYSALSLANVIGALIAVHDGDTVKAAIGAVVAGLMAWCAWDSWRKRPPRKRRPSRVAARVRDLGHRLTVTPVTAS